MPTLPNAAAGEGLGSALLPATGGKGRRGRLSLVLTVTQQRRGQLLHFHDLRAGSPAGSSAPPTGSALKCSSYKVHGSLSTLQNAIAAEEQTHFTLLLLPVRGGAYSVQPYRLGL